MARKLPEPKIFLDGDVSDQWRVGWVEVRGFDGWIPRTDHWPFGITIKPGTDPAAIRREVCDTLAYPAATLLDGQQVEAITWEPHEVRLVCRGT